MDTFLSANNSQKILRWKWLFFSLISLSLMGLFYYFLGRAWSPVYAIRWLGLALLLFAYVLTVFWRGLPYNYRIEDKVLLPTFGWGNLMTMSRGLLLAALTGFVFSPKPPGWLGWIPGALFVLADATDFLDGYLARRTNHVTRLGELLDMSMDGIGVLLASWLVVHYGKAPGWYILVGTARYIYLFGIWLRKSLRLPIHTLPYSVARRGFAGLQMGFLAVILLPVFSPPGTQIAATLFALPFLVGFVYDFLYASGVIQSQNQPASSWGKALQRWGPLGLRLVLIITGGFYLGQSISSNAIDSLDQTLILAIEILVLFMLIIGAAPRLNSIAGLCLLGIHQISAPLSTIQILLAILYTALLYTGSGDYSLWKPEEQWIQQRAGERKT